MSRVSNALPRMAPYGHTTSSVIAGAGSTGIKHPALTAGPNGTSNTLTAPKRSYGGDSADEYFGRDPDRDGQ